ncbi:hypothetical protein BC826DRAFT_552955 [Russula brevipes]|nr:hypothetical protein BC826DRAFT_552955 [Russula brevipes]
MHAPLLCRHLLHLSLANVAMEGRWLWSRELRILVSNLVHQHARVGISKEKPRYANWGVACGDRVSRVGVTYSCGSLSPSPIGVCRARAKQLRLVCSSVWKLCKTDPESASPVPIFSPFSASLESMIQPFIPVSPGGTLNVSNCCAVPLIPFFLRCAHSCEVYEEVSGVEWYAPSNECMK